MIVDHTPWQRLETLAGELGGAAAFTAAKRSGTVETHSVGGEVYARRITTRAHDKDLVNDGWMTKAEMAARLGVTDRTIDNRVRDGVMERKLKPTQGPGGARSHIRIVKK